MQCTKISFFDGFGTTSTIMFRQYLLFQHTSLHWSASMFLQLFLFSLLQASHSIYKKVHILTHGHFLLVLQVVTILLVTCEPSGLS